MLFIKAGVLHALSILALSMICSVSATQVGNDDVEFVGVRNDHQNAGESTWYYRIESNAYDNGDNNAISHVTFELNLAGCGGTGMVTGEYEWNGVDYTYLTSPLEEASDTSVGDDGSTGYVGVKYDRGFGSGDVRYYAFTVNKNYLPGDMLFVSKSRTTDTVTITGPSSSCSTLEAVDDSKWTNYQKSVHIDILANDVNGHPIDSNIVFPTGPSKGSVVVNADSTVTYTPDKDSCGVDTFTYQISSFNGAETASATVTVTVNCPPVANCDEYTVNEDTTLTVGASSGLLVNDADPDSGATMSVLEVSIPPTKGGDATVDTDGSFTYTPKADFCGDDMFTHVIQDNHGVADTATVTIHVACVNDVPVAN